MDITTQQAINVKYDYYLMERDKNLFTQLSPNLVAWARLNGLNTYNDMVNFGGSVDISNGYSPSVIGLVYLKNITGLHAQNSSISTMEDLSSLTKLTHIELQGNGITSFFSLRYMLNLLTLNINNNSLTTSIVDKILSDLHYIYDHQSTKMTYIDLGGINMATPTGGVNNTNYTYLTGKGVNVIINV